MPAAVGSAGMNPRVKARLQPYVLALRRIRRGELTLADGAWGRLTSFSQFGEDVYLAGYFSDRPNGFYVDVGALHPFFASNTYLLHRKGWRGMNLEPNPAGLRLCERYRPADINLPWAVATVEGEASFVLNGSFSGIDDEAYLWGRDGLAAISVRTRRLDSVFAEYLPPQTEIDFLSVDCEGHDLDVLDSNDWDRWRPRLIAVEAHVKNEPRVFLSAKGYRFLVRLGLTELYERCADGSG